MSERTGLRPWGEGAAYVVLMLIAIYLPLLPFGFEAGGAVLPDVAYLLTAAWVLRRPGSAPLLAVAALALLADALLSRPVGLFALCLILGSEVLRSRWESLRDEMFVAEWLTVAAVYAAMTAAALGALTLSFSRLPDTGPMLAQVFVTVAAYPVVAAFLHWGLRIRAAKSADRFGRFGRLR